MVLKIGKTNVTKLLREKYAAAAAAAAGTAGWISLIQVPPERHMETNVEALKILLNEMKYKCVYITLSKPFKDLDKLFKSKGVDTSNLFFIDAVSQMYAVKETPTKRCVYVSGPVDIESITSSLRELLFSIGMEKKCVFLDSITTVLLYNSLPRALRFSKFITETLKRMEVDGVMVSIAKGGVTSERLLKELAKVCDEVIDITEES